MTLVQRSNRGRRRNPSNGSRPAAPANPQATDRYEKFLPEWMRGNGGAPPPRPRRPRPQNQNRRNGGYTPGKFAGGDRLS